MTINATYPLVVPKPQAEAGAVVAALNIDGVGGLAPVVEAVQGLWANKIGSLIADHGDDLGYPTIGAKRRFLTRAPRLGRSGESVATILKMYVSRGSNVATCVIRVTNVTSGVSASAEINGGFTTTGAWWTFPAPPPIREQDAYTAWEIETTAATVESDASRKARVYEVSMAPIRTRTTLTANPLGYLDGAIPVDEAHLLPLEPATPPIIYSAGKTAIATWEEAPGQIASLGLNPTEKFAIAAQNASDSPYYQFFRAGVAVPEGAAGATGGGLTVGAWRILDVVCRVRINGSTLGTFNVHTKGVWNVASFAVPQYLERRAVSLEIEATGPLGGLSAWWTRGNYGATTA